MSKATKIIAATASLLFCSANAFAEPQETLAGTTSERRNPQPPYEVVPFTPPDGEPARTVESGTVKGMGNGFPLEKALLNIVPGSRQLQFDTDLNREMLVSYRGGRHWVEVLRELEANYGLKFDISDRYVFASKTDAIIVTTDPILKAVEATVPDNSGEDTELDRILNERVRAKGQYVAMQGDRVSYVVRTWAKATGWYVSYKSSFDYEIEREYVFEDDFETSIAKLITSFKNSKVPLRAQFYPSSRVILITDSETPR